MARAPLPPRRRALALASIGATAKAAVSAWGVEEEEEEE